MFSIKIKCGKLFGFFRSVIFNYKNKILLLQKFQLQHYNTAASKITNVRFI